jgi:hypothetical protein
MNHLSRRLLSRWYCNEEDSYYELCDQQRGCERVCSLGGQLMMTNMSVSFFFFFDPSWSRQML